MTWGDQTYQEMMVGFFDVAVLHTRSMIQLFKDEPGLFRKSPTTAERGILLRISPPARS